MRMKLEYVATDVFQPGSLDPLSPARVVAVGAGAQYQGAQNRKAGQGLRHDGVSSVVAVRGPQWLASTL